MAKSKEMEIAISIAGRVEKSLGAAFNKATSGLGSITRAAASATKSIGSVTKSAAAATAKGLGTVARASAAATTAAATAVGGLGAAAVNVGKEFETAMSQVSATMLIDKSTKEGQEAFATLENAARECGRSTAFSASEAAEGLNYLALAGYDAEKAATALPTVLNLAGAGAMGLADASNMVTDAMSALGIEATEKNLSSFADNLAMTASKSNTSVSELGEAILTVGGTAKYLSGGTTELSTCIGLLADNGIHASEGGTKLRNMITSLTAPTDKAAEALNGLGVSAFDSEGNMRDMQGIFQDLNAAMAGMSTDDKSATLSKIFNKTDLKAVNALLGTSTQRWDELSGAIEDSAGACEEMYALQLDNLEGDIKILQSGLSDLGISVYKDLGTPLREMTQTATGMVEKLSNAYGKGGMEGMVSAVGGCISETVGEISGYIPKVVDMGVGLMESFIGGIGEGSGDIARAAVKTGASFVSGMCTVVPQALAVGADILLQFLEGVDGQIPRLVPKATKAIETLLQGASKKAPDMLQAGIDIILGLVDGISAGLPTIMALGTQVVMGLVMGIGQRMPDIAGSMLMLIQALVDGAASNGPGIALAAAQLIDGFVTGAGQMLPAIIQIASVIVLSLIQGIAAALPSFAASAVQVITLFVSGLIQALPTLIQGALLLVQSLVDAISQAAPLLLASAIQLVGSLIIGLVQALPRLIQMGIQLVLNLVQGLLSNLPLILQMGTKIIVSLVSGLTQSLPHLIQGGFQLITSLIQGIAQNLPAIAQAAVTIILSLIGGLITAIPQLIDAALSLPSVIIDAILTTDWLKIGMDLIVSIGKGIVDGALSIGDSVMNTIKGWFGGGDQDASDKGAAATQSFAAGIESNAPAVSGAASTLSATAFSDLDLTGALTAGQGAGTAFSTGLSDSLTDGLDTEAFNAGMLDAGKTGATALGDGLGAGLADISIDTSAFTTDLTAIGTDGAAAISTGMTGNAQAVAAAATGLGDDINASFDDSWTRTESNAQEAMHRLTDTVTTAAQQAAQAVRSAFEGMEITIPEPKIPVINVSEKAVPYGEGGNVSVPRFSVAWNALGGVFRRPTIFSTSAGFQGAGEAGPEAILPLDILWKKMREIIDQGAQQDGTGSMVDTLVQRLGGAAHGSGKRMELSGMGGTTIQYCPTFNLYGTASRQEVEEADKMSRKEFAKMMERYEKDLRREKFRRG